jgi:hypothetical protein
LLALGHAPRRPRDPGFNGEKLGGTSATFREILDAMWLFTDKFQRARARYAEIKDQERARAAR